MKKIIIMLIGILLSVIPCSVKAGELDTLIRWDLDMSIVTHKVTNGNEVMTNLLLRTGNGIPVYCIEPGKEAINDMMHNSTYNISDTNMGNIDINELNLLGYYGYNYEGHTDIKYYMATQELIWRYMKVDDVYYTYGKYGERIDLSSYKNEILSLVNNHYKVPSFNFLNRYVLGEEVIVEDSNNVLSGYELDGTYNNIRIDGNKIIINIIDKNNSFKLKRKDTNVSTKYFYRDNYQTVAYFGNPNNVSKEYNVDYTYGNITVNKLDYDTKEKVPSTKESSLEHAKYALYDELGNELEVKETNIDGIVIFDNLIKGIYTVKEIEPSTGYTLDENSYKIYVHSYNKDIVIKSYEKVIKSTISITKVYDDKEKGIMLPEDNITFDVYDIDNNLYNSYTTNEEGKVSFDLPYGTYTIKQNNAPEGVKKIDDFIINVEQNNEIKEYVLVNKKKEEPIKDVLPKTGKNINYIYVLVLLLILGVYYEKKYL